MQVDRTDALLQYMMVRPPLFVAYNLPLIALCKMSFLPPPAIRQLIAVPTQDRVDFRAACFCHKRIVEIGFVCSVCLSSAYLPPRILRRNYRISVLSAVFCQPVPVCSTCR